jgi:hypothetical protein
VVSRHPSASACVTQVALSSHGDCSSPRQGDAVATVAVAGAGGYGSCLQQGSKEGCTEENDTSPKQQEVQQADGQQPLTPSNQGTQQQLLESH